MKQSTLQNAGFILLMGLSCFLTQIEFPRHSLAAGVSEDKVGLPLPDSVTAVSSTKTSSYSNELIVHLLDRITLGPAPGDLDAVKHMGVDTYIEQQLHPQSIKIPDKLQQVANASTQTITPAYLFHNFETSLKTVSVSGRGSKQAYKGFGQRLLNEAKARLYDDTSTARIERALYSPAQLKEVMTDFWYNHFNVSMDKDFDAYWVGAYEDQAIRPHVLGKFRDLLGATAHHAAMLYYLDNWQNTDPKSKFLSGRFQGINENYARELLELHTLGVDGGYTQKDVQELARILTGLGLMPGGLLTAGMQGKPQQYSSPAHPGRYPVMEALHTRASSAFNGRRHDFSDKVFMGQTIQGSGEKEIEQVLDMLSKHLSTAHHISFELAQFFVSDNPPASLVDKLSKRFLETDGDIAAVKSQMATVFPHFNAQDRSLANLLRA